MLFRYTLIGFLLLGLSPLFGKGEYNSKYLYTETNPNDKGAITVKIDPGNEKVKVDRVVAFARKSRKPYLGKLSRDGKTASFQHLPIDKYDLLIVTDDTFYDGFRLVRKHDAEALKPEAEAIAKEVKGIEGFFDGKVIERIEYEGAKAVVVLQQWRIGTALAESGARLKGTIHSIDLIWFEKPHRGWQLIKRRQLYREETPRKAPLKHKFLKELSNIRVAGKGKTVTVKLPAAPPPKKPLK